MIETHEFTERPSTVSASRERTSILLACAAFAVLCIAALSFAPLMMEPDDYAYQASIVAITHGHFFTLSAAQATALAAQLPHPSAPGSQGLIQWVRLPDGRWVSEKDPGYPFLAAPFQLLGIMRVAPLFYGALGCVGLYFGGRRWLGHLGGAVAVGLFCSSGAALFFAWRDYMPTFTEASLIAAGTGALLWTVLATDAAARRRTWAGLAGFVALEAAVFVRYTDIVVLGCAVVAVVVAWRVRSVGLPRVALLWWLGTVAVFGAGVAVFDDAVYGGPFTFGYRAGEVRFGLKAVLPNLRYMPAHLIEAMPVLVPGLVALVWIAWQRVRLRRVGGESAALARREFAVGYALAASWFAVWGTYATYAWTTHPGMSTLQVVRFYVPAIGAMALLAAWPVVRVPRRALVGTVASAALVVAFGLGAWTSTSMRDITPPSPQNVPSPHRTGPAQGGPSAGAGGHLGG